MAMTPQQMSGYISSQQNRLNTALKSNDKGLAAKLLADAKNKGYTLKSNGANPVKPVLEWQPPAKNTNTETNTNNGKTTSYTGSNSIEFVTGTDMNKPNTTTSMMNKTQSPTNPISQPNAGTNNGNSSDKITMDNIKTDDPLYYFVNPDALKNSSFNYDFTQDPLYLQALQSSLNQANLQTKKDQQQALEALNERGISNSSITQNQFQQIASDNDQRARDSVINNLVPQLMQQAYGRFQDQRDFNFNKGIQEAGILGTYNGKNTLDMQKYLQTDQQLKDEKARNIAQDTEEKKRWWAQFKKDGEQWTKQHGLDWAKLSEQQKEYASDQAYRDKTYRLNERSQNWAENPNNPLNMSREATAESKGSTDKKDYVAQKKNEFLTKLQSQDMTYEDVMNSINIDEMSGSFDSNDKNENKRIADEIRSTVDSFMKKNKSNNNSGFFTNMLSEVKPSTATDTPLFFNVK